MAINESLKEKLQLEIQDLAGSITGIVETFRSMRSPLVESQERMPKATIQLDKIADQTEEAAHLMLDKIEQITQREEEVIEALGKLSEQSKGALSADAPPLVDVIKKSQANLDDAYLVMDALQFQDITSQQIQYAAAMLEEVEVKLKKMVVMVTGNDNQNESNDTDSESISKRVFDPNAEFVSRKTDQSDVDSLFNKVKK